MSVLTLFTKTAPTLAGVSFDAVLEDTFSASVTYTTFPLSSGASATDHGIIEPFEWQMTGIVSNDPIKPGIADFTGALTNFVDESGIAATVGGLAAGLLAGSNQSRAGETLSLLIALMAAREPFDVDAGDIQLTNMVITNITRVKNPSNENALVFAAQLIELPTVDTAIGNQQPSQEQLPEDDPAQTQAASLIDRGEQALRTAGANIVSAVQGILP